uniref:Ig-like domain-containing protein n=1 Tax=Callorhinchus milii TaxID=7868 RepID=A0A4W3IBB8_CALMI
MYKHWRNLRSVTCSMCQTPGDSVTQLQYTVTTTEGKTVYLQCNYTTTNDNNAYLFWYHQYRNKAPEYILNTYIRNNKQQSAEVTDSSEYYCALSPTEAQISGSSVHPKQ